MAGLVSLPDTNFGLRASIQYGERIMSWEVKSRVERDALVYRK
jgi:hypothetical protein